MLLLGVKNVATQTVGAGALVNLGSVYRRYCKNNAFSFTGNSVSLNHVGIYKLTVTAVVSAPAAGDVTLQLFENGISVPGAFATETITTADTEFRTLVIDYYFKIDSTCALGCSSVDIKAITLVNTGDADITVSNVVLNTNKEVY